MLVFQVCLQGALRPAHGDAAYVEVIIQREARPGTVHGDKAAQYTVVDDAHWQIAAGAAVAVAVQDTLGSVPDGAGHDGFVVVRLVVLVLAPAVGPGLVVVEIGRPGLAGENIAAILLIAEDVANRAGRPACVAEFGADLVPARFPLQFRQRIRDGCQRCAVDQHVVHEADRPRFILVDAHAPADNCARFVPVDHLVVSKDRGKQEAAAAEAPFQAQKHRL